MSLRFETLLFVCLGLPSAAVASESRFEIAGPVAAQLIRVIDGDTILVAAKPWPQQTMEVYVRLRGIDAPEIRSSCLSVREAGKAAKTALSELIRHDQEIQLTQITGDKYFGRVLADIVLSSGQNPAQEMLVAGYVAPYDGGTKSKHCASP